MLWNRLCSINSLISNPCSESSESLKRPNGLPGDHAAAGIAGCTLPSVRPRGLVTVLRFAVTGNFQMDSWFHRAASGPRIRSHESQGNLQFPI